MASGSTLILNYTNNQQHLDLILQGVTVELLQNQNWYGNVTLSGTNTFNVAENKTWSTSSGSWNNASGQTGAITKTGAGTLTLGNSTSNWTGLTTVTAGTLRTNTTNALGTSACVVQVNGGVLDVRNTLADEITLNGGTLYGYNGTISNTITLSQNSTIEAGSTTTITGVITDGDNSYSVTKTGNGLLYLSSSSGNTYDGGTTISAGEIEVRNHNDNLGTGTVTIDDGAGLDVYNRTINNSLIINGAYTSSYGNLFSSNTGTYTGTILMNAAASIGGIGTLTISGVIDDGGNNYTLTKIGTGTVYLTATNTYGGGTIIQDGYLGIDNDDNLGDLPGSTDADNIQLGTSNAFLFATAADVTINTARGITLLADGNALGADSGDQLTYDGIITGDYNLKIERDSNGTVVLGGTNTYSGSTEISAGTLKISADANLGTAPAEATANHLYLSGGRLHTTATITLNSNRGMYLGASYSRLEVANDTTLTYNGIITGASTTTDLVLNMSGTTGTLVLGGTSTYTGSTKIYDGTLSISDELNLGPTSCNNNDCIELFNAGVLQITDDVTFGNNQVIKISNSDNTKILIATGKTITLNHEFYNNSSEAYVLTINDGSHDGKLHMTTSAVITSNSAVYSFSDSTNGGFVVANGTLQLDDYRNLTYDYSSSYASYLTIASGATLILNEASSNQQYVHLILQGVTVELLQNQNWYGNVTLSGTNTFNVAENKTWSTSSGSWNNASG